MAVSMMKPAKLALLGAAMLGAAQSAAAVEPWIQREGVQGSVERREQIEERRQERGAVQAPQQPSAPRSFPPPQSQPQAGWAPRPAPQAMPAPNNPPQGGWAGRPAAPSAPTAPSAPAPAPNWGGHGSWASRPPQPGQPPVPVANAPVANAPARDMGYVQRGSAPPPQPGRDRNDWINRGTAGVPHYADRDGDRWRDAGRWRDNGRWHGGDYRRWDNGWRHDNRYDWHGWRDNHRDWYRLGRYYPPYRGWSYRRLSVGFVLDALFWSDDYWIADPFYYRLPPAYGPYRWVRYYDDALLVDTYTGQVVDVIYGVFW